MSFYYNMTNVTNADNFLVQIQNLNPLSGYIVGFMILIILFIVLFIAFKNFGVRTTLPITFFLCTIAAFFLATLSLIPDFMVYIMLIGTAGLVLAGVFINPEGG